MLATPTPTPTPTVARLRGFAGRHAVATGLSVALAAAVAGLGAGFAIAAPAPAITPDSPTAVITSATTTTGVAAHPIIRGLVGLTAKDTGQSLAQVRTLLRQNETLNQIAGGQVAAVIQAVDAAVGSKISAEEEGGKITPAQAATLTAKADNRITQVMAAPGRRILLALRGGAKASPGESPAPSPSASPTA
jgi:hypothetical protein